MDRLQSDFLNVLQQELGQLTRLESVLGQEHEALKRRDSDALLPLIKEKQTLVTAIEALGGELPALLKRAGHSNDKEAVLVFIDTAPQLRQQWDELEALLLRCQRQNQVNGVLLERGRWQTQQLLGILLGEGNQRETELYNAKGTASPSFLHGRSVKV